MVPIFDNLELSSLEHEHRYPPTPVRRCIHEEEPQLVYFTHSSILRLQGGRSLILSRIVD